MAVAIRLARIGKKKAPFYRIVAIDSRRKRDGGSLENLGTFNPLTCEFIQYHQERIQAWVACGAQMSDAVKKIDKMYKKNAQQTA
jgi:small subunit ribosomal protein S16